MKIAINGFGRIGRTVFRILRPKSGIDVVAINDITDPEALAYLLRRDSVMGPFPGTAVIEGDKLVTDTGSVQMLSVRNPAELPWREMAVDYVIESSGVFRKRAEVAAHLEAGAKKVILTVPAKDEIDATIVMGVNHEDLKPAHKIVSNASCTTNCLAPLAYVLDKEFGIARGLMTTIHAYTNGQRLVDTPHKDLRRARAAAMSIIPTTTGAARAVGMVLPQLMGKMDGMAFRVPVACGSIVDLVTIMKRDVTVTEVNEALQAAAATERFQGVLEYASDPLVSVDIVGNSHSSIFDPGFTNVIGGNMLKTTSWYDNEWGYSSRVIDLLELMHEVG